MTMYRSELLLQTGAVIGAVGVTLMWSKVSPFWAGGFVTAAGCALIGVHYGLGAIQAPTTSGLRLRRVISLGAASLTVLLGVGVGWLSVRAFTGQPIGATEKTIGDALLVVGILSGVLVVSDMVTDRDE